MDDWNLEVEYSYLTPDEKVLKKTSDEKRKRLRLLPLQLSL
jgi:hypothetical protein